MRNKQDKKQKQKKTVILFWAYIHKVKISDFGLKKLILNSINLLVTCVEILRACSNRAVSNMTFYITFLKKVFISMKFQIVIFKSKSQI